MNPKQRVAPPDISGLLDLDLAQRIGMRDPAAVRLMTERNNQRLFRTAWSILGNRAEAEDAVQSGYSRAFAAIGTFAGRSSLSTWLTRIVINEALGRERAARRRRTLLDAESVTDLDAYREKLMNGSIATGRMRRSPSSRCAACSRWRSKDCRATSGSLS